MTTAAPATISINWSTLIRAAPRLVYAAFATAEGHDGWWTEGAVVEPWPGGALRLSWEDWGPNRPGAVAAGTVLEARPGERFCFRWHGAGPDQPTTVALTFTPDEQGTVVRVQEQGFPDTSTGRAAAARCAAAWGEALTLAKLYVEHGVRARY